MASINCVSQSNDGYVYIGTDGAELVRYNGSTFEEIRDPDGDNNHHFQNIFFHNDEILFASLYKGFYSINKNTNTIIRQETDVKFGEALAYLTIEDTYYCIGTRAVFSIKDGKTRILKTFGDNDLTIHNITIADEAIFVFTNKGQCVLSKNKLISLSEWLKVKVERIDEFKFGYYDDGKLTILNDRADRWLEITPNNRGGFFSIDEHDTEFLLQKDERAISFSYNAMSKEAAFLTNEGGIYRIKGRTPNWIAHNYSEPFVEAKTILTDYNGDFWITSEYKGLYKVSLETFTKLQLLPIYEEPNIGFPYRTIYGDIFISLMSGETHVLNIYSGIEPVIYNYSIHGIDEINGKYYIGTTRGVKIYNPSVSNVFIDGYFDNQNITSIIADKNLLYVGVAGSGLHIINTSTDEITQVVSNKISLPGYFYTAQKTNNNQEIIFGTNNGLYIYSKSNKQIRIYKTPSWLGSYSGVSTRDIYGNLWFTLEKGIFGITTKGNTSIIKGDEYLKTNLFYTLNSDNYGNLIVGTNKGVTILKLNRAGEVQDARQYDGNSGFEGYETHMRSQFQSENGIFVGTVEGLFLINTQILENLKSPLAPIITSLDRAISEDNAHNSFNFKFHVNNARAGKIKYSYRLVGQDENWQILESGDVLRLYGLSNGDYTLEVRSTFDNIRFSDSSFYKFKVQMPIWKTTWFILVVLVLIIGFNIALLYYNKSFDTSSLLDTKDTSVHLRMTPAILMFATISVTGAHILAPVLNPELSLHLAMSLLVGFVLLTLFFLSLTARKNGNEHMFNYYLIIGLAVVVLHFFYEIYMSNLHPFHIIGVILTCMMVPYILGKIKSTIVFSMAILTASVICMVLINDPVYSKTYFLIAIVVMLSLLIFTSYLRYDSVEKLMFISGIINKGNIPAVAFNQDGTITYVSENISHFIGDQHDKILHQNVSILNNYVPFEGRYREVDVLKDFQDNGTYLVPMTDGKNKVRWIEWSYKNFSKNVNVMLGQDITEKMELENTYELLVQHAEDFIYRCDVNGNFIFLNDICYNKMGYERTDLVGKSSLDIIAQSHREEIANYYAEHFTNKSISSYKEFPIVKKDGSVIWVGQYVTTLFAAGSDNYINGFIALARDITEDRRKKHVIKEQRDSITSSINYAQRIQMNLLPHQRLFNSYFEENFIIYKPKDIVSGDFYWMEKLDDKIVLAVGDCTGHGVPGSFMTLLGINLLNSIVHEERNIDPGEILNELDKRLVEILPRGKGKTKVNDGMEISVIVIDEKSNEIAFGCAGSRFLIYSDNEFTMYKGDNKHIGDLTIPGFEGYITNYTQFNPDDQLYLFTDGFQDQFGGPNDKKYSFRRMLELLEENIHLPLDQQQEIIEKEFDAWIGNGEQTDDLSVISVRRHTV